MSSSSQWPPAPFPGDPALSSGLCWHPHTCGTHRESHTYISINLRTKGLSSLIVLLQPYQLCVFLKVIIRRKWESPFCLFSSLACCKPINIVSQYSYWIIVSVLWLYFLSPTVVKGAKWDEMATFCSVQVFNLVLQSSWVTSDLCVEVLTPSVMVLRANNYGLMIWIGHCCFFKKIHETQFNSSYLMMSQWRQDCLRNGPLADIGFTHTLILDGPVSRCRGMSVIYSPWLMIFRYRSWKDYDLRTCEGRYTCHVTRRLSPERQKASSFYKWLTK